MKNLFVILIIALLSLSCKSDDNIDAEINENSKANLRIENTSNVDFENLYVNTGGGEFLFGNVNAGVVSAYREFNSLYAYAFIQLTIEGDTFTIQPIDYVGETKYETGNYTYQLNTYESDSQISGININFVIDN